MKSISVHTARSALMPGAAPDVGGFPRRPALAGRRTVTRAAGREHRTILPFPANFAAEMQKANDALISARRLRQYVEYWIGEQGLMLG